MRFDCVSATEILSDPIKRPVGLRQRLGGAIFHHSGSASWAEGKCGRIHSTQKSKPQTCACCQDPGLSFLRKSNIGMCCPECKEHLGGPAIWILRPWPLRHAQKLSYGTNRPEPLCRFFGNEFAVPINHNLDRVPIFFGGHLSGAGRSVTITAKRITQPSLRPRPQPRSLYRPFPSILVRYVAVAR
jgi:hypothetical protein